MEMTGEYRIQADRATVWQALNDPEILKTAIPGCEELFRNADGTLTAKIESGAEVFPVEIVFSEVVAPQSCRISIKRNGGSVGEADVRLADTQDGTLLTYSAETPAGGKTAHSGFWAADDDVPATFESFFAAFAASLTLAPPLANLSGEAAAEEELIDRLEHRVDDFAEDIAETAEEIEEEVEVAAGRGFLGGPYVWGLIALLVVIVLLAILH